jgi:hypothetical protein
MSSEDWNAISAVATAAAVIVALWPILSGWIHARRMETFRLEQIRSLLISLQSVLPVDSDRDEISAQILELVAELSLLVSQLAYVEARTLRVLLASVAASRVYCIIAPGAQGRVRAATLTSIDQALAALATA